MIIYEMAYIISRLTKTSQSRRPRESCQIEHCGRHMWYSKLDGILSGVGVNPPLLRSTVNNIQPDHYVIENQLVQEIKLLKV